MLKRALLVLLISSFGCIVSLTNGPYQMIKNAGDIEEGKRQYNSMLALSKVPRYGQCWKKALERLHVDCSALTDDTQSRLALLFTNCFLDKSGHKVYPCELSAETKSCTRDMDTTAFHAYTTFFTHTQNMCFFVKSQVWHEETENTISRLLDTSSAVQHRMVEHLEMQKLLLSVQKESLENDQRLLDRNEELNRALENSKAGVEQMFREFHDSTSERHQFVTQMFDRVVRFHSAIVGEFAGVYSLVFFLISMSVSYLLTTAKRTANARFWLLCITAVNYGFEKVAIGWKLEENVLMDSVQDVIYYRVWIVRNVSCWLGLTTLAVFAYRYRDLNSANNELLQQITRQNSDIVSRLAALSPRESGSNLSDVIALPTSTTSESDEQTDTGTGSSCERYRETSSSEDNGNLSPPFKQVMVESFSNGFKGPPVKRTPKTKNTSSANSSHNSTPRNSPYNLRSRRPTPTSMNPVVHFELPELFAATVHRLATISKENSIRVRKAVKAERMTRCAQFSSDDDGF